MQLDRKTSSAWVLSLDRELKRGKQVLLHGNVADEFLVNGEYLSLRDFLDRYLPESGFQLALHYDIVDGIRFADPARMQALFQQVRTGGPPAAPVHISAPGTSRRVAPAAGPPTTPAPQGADPALQRPDLALPV